MKIVSAKMQLNHCSMHNEENMSNNFINSMSEFIFELVNNQIHYMRCPSACQDGQGFGHYNCSYFVKLPNKYRVSTVPHLSKRHSRMT